MTGVLQNKERRPNQGKYETKETMKE